MNFKLTKSAFTLSFKKRVTNVIKIKYLSSRDIKILMGLLLLLSVLAWAFYFKQDLILSYNDARSRLNIARRVFDSLQPGFAQIGSVWLPLYHIAELPFVWNDYLWHSGIAGSIPSMISYVLGGYYLLRLTKVLKFDIWASLLTFSIYALNPNLLFMQAIPMTESLLIFLAIASCYYIVSWVKTDNIKDLIGGALFTFLSTLTRYDGWFLVFFATFVVFFVTFKKRGWRVAEGTVVMFVTLAGLGVFLWLLWNYMIFNDPFYFALGPFSAKAQQDVLNAEGRLLSKGNPIYSFFLYLLVAKFNVGIWLLILSSIGIVYFVKSKNYKSEVKLAVSLLFVPFIFNVFSLIAGHSVIHIPQLPPYTWFNDRYGLMVLPAVALVSGFIVQGKKAVFVVSMLILLNQNYTMYMNNDIITIEDGVRGSSGEFLDSAGNWLQEHAQGGLILVATSSNDALLFKSGLPLKRFIYEGAEKYWAQALENPTINAEWVVMHKGDLVYENLRENENFLENYTLYYKDDFSYIYKRDFSKQEPLTVEELPH